jgi:hypothetical protein
MSIDGYKFLSDGKGILLQKKLIEEEEKFKIEQDKKRKEEEKKEKDEKYKFDMDYIDDEYIQLLSQENNILSADLNFDINEEIDKNLNFQFSRLNFN